MYLNYELGIKNYGKNYISILTMAVVLFAYPLYYAHANTESKLRERIEARQKEIQKLEEEIVLYQKTLSQTRDQSKTLKEEIVRVETQIKKLNADMRLTKNRIGATELRIEELDGSIVENETKMDIQRRALAQTLQAVHQTDTDSLVEVLLQYERISDFFGSLEDIQNLEKSIHDDLGALRELKIILEEERASRTKQRETLFRLDQELESRRTIEESAKKSKNTLLVKTKNEEARYQQLVKEQEVKREEMLNEIQRTEDELRRLINPSAIPKSETGVLAWPIKGSVALTQSFGNTPDSKILYHGKPHNGIDLRAPVGTPLYAADSGEIWETGDTDIYPGCLSYGKWVLIKHPNNLATLYAHLSRILVTPKTSVTRGDLIGYTGETGYATGPHLHFTVYDANTVQFRASKISGSNCQYLPYGGYLNPLAYL